MDFNDASHQSLLKAHPSLAVDGIKTKHVCVETRSRHVWLQFVREWYLIPLYLSYTTAVAFYMVKWLNGSSFAIDGSSNRNTRLTQSDVTTLLSVVMVVGRTICSAWQALATWRCAFILLEKNGLSLADTSRLISWRVPTLTMFRRSSTLHTGHDRTRAMAILILLLAWPAQFSNPIASGSVSWVPSRVYQSSNSFISLSGPPSPRHNWQFFSRYSTVREGMVKLSAGYASTTMESMSGGPYLSSAQRIVTQLKSYPNATAVKNATIPIFKIEDFEWVTDGMTLPPGIEVAVKDSLSGYLNISRQDGPLAQVLSGNSALLKDTPWLPPPETELPPAELFSGIKYAAIYISRNDNKGQGDKYDCHSGKSEFDPLPDRIKLINVSWDNNHTDCLAVAKLQITAGVTQCYQEHMPVSSDPTCLLSSGVLVAKNTTVSADILVQQVFSIMPEVQGLVAALGLSDPKAKNSDLEVHLRNSLIRAYQGSWSVLTDYFSDPEHQVRAEVWQPSPLLQAQVLAWRMYLWLGINMLLVASGLLLFAVQTSCRVKTVNDPVVASLMMDSSVVTETDKTGLCNATDIGAGHGNADLKLFLKVDSYEKPQPLFAEGVQDQPSINNYRDILSAIRSLTSNLVPDSPVFSAFHDGRVHDPLGAGSYAFHNDLVEPILQALKHDEILSGEGELHENDQSSESPEGRNLGPDHVPTRPILIHVGAQPNNSPHVGTLVVFCHAFSVARAIQRRTQKTAEHAGAKPPSVSVHVGLVDTAPVNGEGVNMGDIHYQRSYRDVPGALNTYMADYEAVFQLLSSWSGIPYEITFQRDLFSNPIIPSLMNYIVAHRDFLGQQLSPKYGSLALRAACPISGCAIAEKHGRLNTYSSTGHSPHTSASSGVTITFTCPEHGPHTVDLSKPSEVSRLEANAPLRNLIRSMSHLLDQDAHYLRITGSDYAGMYQEMFLYRPLAAWSAVTGLAAGRTPHILYAPLIVDWSGAKLSKSLYIGEGGYGCEALELLGTGPLVSFAALRNHFGDDGSGGLERIWNEVQVWLKDPKKLFRSFSIEYLQRVILLQG
ncbi:hypothetical protein BHE90_014286 [Fusarium euwallaceae]|uniref:Uncharacterized protein n=1 Tax=Fusarium euwallaceae TaxID=1147111 RepID=A0A430L6L5_9HYPO|nr:hypothetical protein BHE90_014286 [Fusarium euwallaceae]